jgi:hypothetical protein
VEIAGKGQQTKQEQVIAGNDMRQMGTLRAARSK